MRVVFPIVTSYEKSNIDTDSICKYIRYIESEYGTEYSDPILMTTAGTSQFNLLSKEEVREININLIKESKTTPIVGIPMLSLKESLMEIKFYNEYDCYPMLLFPDRFYNDQVLIDFFYEIADVSNNPIYVHGMWLRKGNGGFWDYTSSIINKLASHKNIKGIKEETRSLGDSFNSVNIDKYFDIIVAGGSMRRHWFLFPSKENVNFLSGVGSIFPTISKEYSINFNNGNYDKCVDIIRKYETPLFKVFMEIGWHASLKYALYKKGFIKENRLPCYNLTDDEKSKVDNIINEIENNLK